MKKTKSTGAVKKSFDQPAAVIDSPVPQKVIDVGTEQKHADFFASIDKDFDGSVDPFILTKKDPSYEYRFLRVDDKNLNVKTSNLLYKQGGWMVCPREHLLKIGIREEQISADGSHRRGADTVLAYMPKELFKLKQEKKQKEADAPIKNIDRNLKSGDKSAINPLHPSMEPGLRTAQQLGMKT